LLFTRKFDFLNLALLEGFQYDLMKIQNWLTVYWATLYVIVIVVIIVSIRIIYLFIYYELRTEYTSIKT